MKQLCDQVYLRLCQRSYFWKCPWVYRRYRIHPLPSTSSRAFHSAKLQSAFSAVWKPRLRKVTAQLANCSLYFDQAVGSCSPCFFIHCYQGSGNSRRDIRLNVISSPSGLVNSARYVIASRNISRTSRSFGLVPSLWAANSRACGRL